MSTSEHAEENSGEASGRELQRHLTNRHIQLMAIGGAIGTGLFMGSGKTIATAGPSILLVYLIIGSALFLFMRAMGELLLSDQSYGTFADIVRDFLGPTMGFVVGCVGLLQVSPTSLQSLDTCTSGGLTSPRGFLSLRQRYSFSLSMR